MATCGQSYATMLVTEDGKTPDSPWNVFAGPTDYDEWRDVAKKIGAEVYRRWDWMISVEKRLKAEFEEAGRSAEATPYPERGQVKFMLTAFDEKLEDLSHPILEVAALDFTWEPSVRKAIDVGRDGTCMLEMLDKAVRFYEETPLPSTSPPREPGTGKTEGRGDKDGLGVLLVAGMVILGVGGAAWVQMKHRAKPARPERRKKS